MSMSASLLRRAIELFREGKKDEANRLLKAVVRQEPTNQIAWNWYIETISDPQERVHTLEEYLLIYPESRQGLKALQALKQRGAAHETAIQPPNPLPTSLTEQAHPIPPASTSRPATAPLTAANATPKAAPPRHPTAAHPMHRYSRCSVFCCWQCCSSTPSSCSSTTIRCKDFTTPSVPATPNCKYPTK